MGATRDDAAAPGDGPPRARLRRTATALVALAVAGSTGTAVGLTIPAHEQPPAAARVAIAAPIPALHPLAATAPTATAVADPALWTVQVSAFRSRFLAEDLRARLGARGLDAYVVSSATEGGQVRYRVRVGAYASRGDAERVAAELRAERTLNPYVTPRAR